MTIAAAFNEIAVAQGGTASSSGTIAGAIDALTDALAGSDVQSPSTIEGAVRLLGQHIGGGGGGSLGGWVEVGAFGGGEFYVSASLGGTDVCSAAFADEHVIMLAGGLQATISFETAPASAPTATLGMEQFTDFTYEDGIISFTVPDGGGDEPGLSFLFN